MKLGGWILKSTTRASYLEMLTAMTIDINESFWDQTCLAMILVSYVILQCEDFYFMHTLPQLHLYYASMMGRLIKEKPFIKREIILFLYTLLFFGVVGFVIINIGFSLRLAKALDTTFPCVLTIFISATVFHLLLALPTVIQAALFGECSGNLCLWIEVLGDNILKNDMPCLLLRDCWKLHQGLAMTSKMFSAQIGSLFIISLLGLVLLFYHFVPFFIGKYLLETPDTLLIIGYGSFALFQIMFLCYCNMVSQYVMDELEKLTDILQLLPISESQITFLGQDKYQSVYLRNLIVFKFQSFKGYDAAGFFKLGKPLLVGIFANFITYLIVLVQFNSTTTTNEKIPDEINVL